MARIIRFYKHASNDDLLLNISTLREEVETVSENILTFTKKPSEIFSIDFDLTVIHNSLQLVSNEYPDFQDLTSYSHFLTYGIFYKVFSVFKI